MLSRSKYLTHTGYEERETCEKKPPVFSWARLLNIQLRERHETPVGDSNQQPPDIEGPDVCRGHHNHIRDNAYQAPEPEAGFTPQLDRQGSREARADEGSEGHEGRDELLSGGRDVPADRGVGRSVAVDLRVLAAVFPDLCRRRVDGVYRDRARLYLEESGHGLEAPDKSKVKAILERRQDYDPTGDEAPPVGTNGIIFGVSHDGSRSTEGLGVVLCQD